MQRGTSTLPGLSAGSQKLFAGILFRFCMAFLLACASCASHSSANIDQGTRNGEYHEAASALESQKKHIYNKRSVILYELDAGMLNHYAGNYDASIKLLQDGERHIEAAYTKSVSQIAASLLNNDTSKDYAGEDYEDIYINAFNALNYYHKNKMEDAVVEINRMNEKLAFLSTKYYDMEQKLQQAAEAKAALQGKSSNGLVSSKFANSALARYLGMLFYRANGQSDDARIDREWLEAAFANAPEIYSFPVPSSINEEMSVPAGKARLNVIGFGGISPVKTEKVTRIPVTGKNWVKIALPELQFRPSEIRRIEVIFDSGKTFSLEQLENINAVCRETFQNKVDLIRFRTVLRATVKTATAASLNIAGDVMAESDDATVALVGNILSLVGTAAQVGTEITEKADTRSSRFFPANAWVGGITVDPGVYSFKINYYNAGSAVIHSVYMKDFRIRADALNLAEAVCLR